MKEEEGNPFSQIGLTAAASLNRALRAISRFEHTLGGFGEGRERYPQRQEEYRRRVTPYQLRQGGAFCFADELAKKCRTLREVEEALAASAREDAEVEAAP